MMWVITGIILGLASVWDLKSMRIPAWFLGAGLLISIGNGGYLVTSGKEVWSGWVTGGIPGGISLLLSLGTREQIGYGDGWILLIVGWMLGVNAGIIIGLLGLGCSFLVSAVILLSKKGNRNTRLPFVPFLFLGYLFMLGGKFL